MVSLSIELAVVASSFVSLLPREIVGPASADSSWILAAASFCSRARVEVQVIAMHQGSGRDDSKDDSSTQTTKFKQSLTLYLARSLR